MEFVRKVLNNSSKKCENWKRTVEIGQFPCKLPCLQGISAQTG